MRDREQIIEALEPMRYCFVNDSREWIADAILAIPERVPTERVWDKERGFYERPERARTDLLGSEEGSER